MKIVTWNVNGLRAAIRKGFGDALSTLNPDVLMLQEIRVLPEQLPTEWQNPEGWNVWWNPAEKKGYSGTAILSKEPIRKIAVRGLPSDSEGRVQRVEIDGIQLINMYLPSGSSGEHRQAIKDVWLETYYPWLCKRVKEGNPIVWGGDLNIAHTERDIYYAKSNENTSGYLPHERQWIGNIFDSGWNDTVRIKAGDIHGPYSWWSNRGKARELDRGWRIDYLLTNRSLVKATYRAWIEREISLTISDHAPVCLEIT